VQDENGALLADGLTQPPSDHGSITPTQREDDVASEASDEITQAAQPAELEAELEERMRQVQAARELLDAHEQNQIAAEKKRPAEAATLQQGANNAAVQQKKSGFHTAVRYESNRLQAVREDRANAAATASVREQAQINAAVRYESDALQAVELANQAHDKPNFLTPKLLAKIATNKRLRHAEKAQDEASATKTMENTSELRRLDLQREEQGSQAKELAEAEREDRTKAEAAKIDRANERRSQAGGEAVRQAAETKERTDAARFEAVRQAAETKEAPQREEQVRQTNELVDEGDQAEAGATKLDEKNKAEAGGTKLEKEFFAAKFVASLANITVPDQQVDYDEDDGGMMDYVITICMGNCDGNANAQALKVAIADTDMQLCKAENDLEIAQRLHGETGTRSSIWSGPIEVSTDLVTVLNLATLNLRFYVLAIA
jgi:hypothetical protein